MRAQMVDVARAECSELGALGPSTVTGYNPGDMESADEGPRLAASESTRNPAQAEDAWSAERSWHPHSSSTLPREGVANPQTLGKRAPCATVEEHRTKRRRVESPGNLEQTTNTDTGSLQNDPLSLDFRASSQRIYHVGCAFMLKSRSRRAIVPVGDPFRAPNGWSALLSIEAGQNGQPFVVLDIRINKGRKDRPASDEPSQRIEFSVVWRPKVLVNNNVMIGDLDLQRNLDVELGVPLHHPTTINKYPPEKQHKS